MKKELKILLAAYSFSTFAFSMLAPIYAIFIEKIGGGILEASYAISIFTFMSGLLIFLMSRWENRLKHNEKLLTIGYLILSVAFFSYMFVSRPWHIYIVEVIFSFGIATLAPVYDGLYSKNLDRGNSISEWGNWEGMGYIISAFAALAGGFLTNYFGFQVLFFVMFILSLIAVFISLGIASNKNLTNLNKKRIKNKNF